MVPADAAWPSVLEDLSGIKTLNFGVSGDTTFDGLRRLDAVLAYEMDAVFLEFGINDFFMGIPLDSARSNLSAMARAFLEQGAQVILAGFHFKGQGSQKWHTMYEGLARELGLHLYPNIFRGAEGCPDCFLPDGLHPNRKGYRLMAEEISKFLTAAFSLQSNG